MRFASIGSPVASLWNACRSGRLWTRRGRRGRTRAARGFTLIEALAAIVILALSLSALLAAHDMSLRGAAALDDHLHARLLAQSLLAQSSQHRTVQAPSQGRSGRFAWSVSTSPLSGGGGTPRTEDGQWMLHELIVTVAWPPRREVKLNTLRLLRVP
jgi:general secretion pathway protein I